MLKIVSDEMSLPIQFKSGTAFQTLGYYTLPVSTVIWWHILYKYKFLPPSINIALWASKATKIVCAADWKNLHCVHLCTSILFEATLVFWKMWMIGVCGRPSKICRPWTRMLVWFNTSMMSLFIWQKMRQKTVQGHKKSSHTTLFTAPFWLYELYKFWM